MENPLDHYIEEDQPEQQVQETIVDDTPQAESEATELEELINNSLHLRGVDSLSTDQVKAYLDLHIRPGFNFDNRKKFEYLDFKINWINDSELCVLFNHQQNIVETTSEDDIFATPNTTNGEEVEINEDIVYKEQGYDSMKGALDAIMLLTDFDNIRREHGEFAQLSIADQFSAVDQAPKLEERKCWDLVIDNNNKVIKTKNANLFYKTFQKEVLGVSDDQENDDDSQSNGDEEFPEDYKVIHLDVRFATTKDKKVKNAREFSRYYLVNGEPDMTQRLPPVRENHSTRYVNKSKFQKDIITGEVPETRGMFGYDHDLRPEQVSGRRYSRRRDNQRERDNYRGRWKNDQYFDNREYRHEGGNWNDRNTNRGRGGRRGGVTKNQHNSRNNKPRAQELPDLFPDFGKN